MLALAVRLATGTLPIDALLPLATRRIAHNLIQAPLGKVASRVFRAFGTAIIVGPGPATFGLPLLVAVDAIKSVVFAIDQAPLFVAAALELNVGAIVPARLTTVRTVVWIGRQCAPGSQGQEGPD